LKPEKANWFAVVTKPRQERIALQNLQRQGFECFLPMAENPYQRRSKNNRTIIEPLFPRYLFLNAIAESQNLAPVRSTQGVISMVRFGTELAVIPEYVINAIKQRIETDTGLIKIEPVEIKAGDKVKIDKKNETREGQLVRGSNKTATGTNRTTKPATPGL
jgi:transcriptional antiterminator RfaH